MNNTIIALVFIMAIGAAVLSLQVKDLITAAAMLTVFSFLVAILYLALGAADVGFNEAVLGAGVNGLFFLGAIFKTTRRTKD